MKNKKIELVACLQDTSWNVEDPASCGARGCFSELGSADIHREEIQRSDYEERRETIFKETSGRGHGAVLDQSCFLFSIDNLTRASTLLLCGPQYADHLQQSLRRATAERGFYFPEVLDDMAREIMTEQFELYEKMQKSGIIPAEDARFILPLYTLTTIQTKVDARELMHLHSMAKVIGVPSEVRETVEEMVRLASERAPRLMKNRGTNYEVLAWMPSSQLFSRGQETIENMIENNSINRIAPQKVLLLDSSGIHMSEEHIEEAVMKRNEAELANMKHYHFTFLAPMSIACFHQATRQRTWDQSVQSVYHAVNRELYVVPPTIQGTSFENQFKDLSEKAIWYVRGSKNLEAVGVVPHSLQVYDLIHVNGWNAIHSIGKRTCTEAQWEIRGIARQMAQYIKEVCPEIGKYAIPQCITYRKCPERTSCGLLKS